MFVCVISVKCCEEIVVLVNKYDLYIVDDDCYWMGLYKGLSYCKFVLDYVWYVILLFKLVIVVFRIGFVVVLNGWVNRLVWMVMFSFFGVVWLIL